MPYSFIYDFNRLSQGVFKQLFGLAYETRLHKIIGLNAKKLVKIFKIDEATGLNLADAITLVEDFIEVQATNQSQRERFEKAKRKALLIPHCARSHMDRRCMADFNPNVPSYDCKGCQPDCTINQVTSIGRAKGYDVYVIPGGSCAEKILKDKQYEGVIGVACGMELKMAIGLLKKLNVAGQGVFLTKNGCANTNLNLETLEKVL